MSAQHTHAPAILVLLPCLLDACLAPNHVYACAQFILVTLISLAHLFCKPLPEAGCGSIRQVQVLLRQHSEALLLSPTPPRGGKKILRTHSLWSFKT